MAAHGRGAIRRRRPGDSPVHGGRQVTQVEETTRQRDRARMVEREIAASRRFHAMCVGTAKSGTHSMAAIFGREYASAHEPEHRLMIDTILAREAGDLTDRQLADLLQHRDRRMNLEMDSSQLNGHLIDILVNLFPAAKFVLTIRDVYSFVNSAIDHHIAHAGGSEEWRRINHLKFGGFEHGRHDGLLEELGLFPLAGYVAYWVRHNQGVLDAVPAERLLVVPTTEIRDRFEQIAEFLGIGVDTLDSERSHEYPAVRKLDALGRLEREYVEDRVQSCCAGLMGKYFPDVTWAPR